MQEKNKQLLCLMMGNLLELYDHAIFGFLSYIIVKKFFPEHSELSQKIYAYGMFAVGFLARPFGGVIFGFLSNKLDRKRSLLLSLIIMSLATLSIGIMPDYYTVGVVAPLIIVIARVIQGLSVSWEFPLTMTLTTDLTKNKKGLLGSFSYLSGVLGMLFASIVSYSLSFFLPEEKIVSWGWRVPFVFGAILCLISTYARYIVKFDNVDGVLFGANALKESFLYSKVALLATFLFAGLTGAIFFPIFFYIPKNLLSASSIISVNYVTMITLSIYSIGLVFSGLLSDYIGKQKMVLYGSCLLFILSWFFIDCIMFGKHVLPYVGIIGLAFTLSIINGPIPGLLSSIFPNSHRTGAIALGYNAGISILGGMSPLFLGWLQSITLHSLSFKIYFFTVSLLLLMLSGFTLWSHNRNYIKKEKIYGYI